MPGTGTSTTLILFPPSSIAQCSVNRSLSKIDPVKLPGARFATTLSHPDADQQIISEPNQERDSESLIHAFGYLQSGLARQTLLTGFWTRISGFSSILGLHQTLIPISV